MSIVIVLKAIVKPTAIVMTTAIIKPMTIIMPTAIIKAAAGMRTLIQWLQAVIVGYIKERRQTTESM